MALAENEIEVVVVGFWGSIAGDWIKNECKIYYPHIRFQGPMVKEWSRTCYTFKQEKLAGHFDDTEILGQGPMLNEEEIKGYLDCIDKFIPNAKAIVLSGSWPKNSPEDAYARIIKMSHNREIPTFLDCTGSQLKNALRAHPYCVHLNKNEICIFLIHQTLKKLKSKYLNIAK